MRSPMVRRTPWRVLGCLLLAACGHTVAETPAPTPADTSRETVAKARSAYETGRLHEARDTLAAIAAGSLAADEAAQLRAQVEADVPKLIAIHLELAQRYDPA